MTLLSSANLTIEGATLAEPGNRSQKVHFVEKGMVRTFYNKDGKDITHFFFDENSFTMSLESIYFNKTDPYGREVLEETKISLITVLHRLFDAIFNFRLFGIGRVIIKAIS